MFENRRLLKKAVQRGRSERWGEAYLSHPPSPELSEQLFSRVRYIELLRDARTMLMVFFSILVKRRRRDI
jgi:hypothetical protein